jgi:hypothetical protein
MPKSSASTQPKIPPTSPSTCSEPGPVEGRVQSRAPNGRPRQYDHTRHQARPAPSLASKPFDWRAD